GDPGDLANAANARTAPISIDGRSADVDATVAFDLPQGVNPVDPQTVQVHVTIRPMSQSRTFTAGIVLAGARSDRTYALSIQQASVTVGGSPGGLDQLTGAALALSANVANLDVGVHRVDLSIGLGSGLNLVAISPATVTVTVSAATPPSAAAS
ncbi:MAG TPA: hypothetical protein VGO64_11455, partial [Candidatus Limnocylindrales bacterium]|nr:hypothetical protein [Candidatus Limnocylindrales bacterium]